MPTYNTHCKCGRRLDVPIWKTCNECDKKKSHESMVKFLSNRKCLYCGIKLNKYQRKFCGDEHRVEFNRL